jgi:hypothetical protein
MVGGCNCSLGVCPWQVIRGAIIAGFLVFNAALGYFQEYLWATVTAEGLPLVDVVKLSLGSGRGAVLSKKSFDLE